MSETLSDVKKISQKIKFTHHLRPYVDEILFKCPSNTEDVASRANLHSKTPAARKVESSDEGDITLKSLAKLHRRLIRNSLSVRRSHALYERCMDQALELEELLEHKDQSWLTFSSHVSSSYRGPFKNFVDRFGKKK